MWSHRAPLRSATLALGLLLAPLAAQTPCANCAGTGLVACKACAVERDGGVECCTQAVACRTCQGLLATACSVCRSKSGADEVARRRLLVQQWRTERAGVSKLLETTGKDVQQCRTAHFDVAWASRDADGHARLHRAAQWLEAARTRFLAATGTAASYANLPRLQVALARDDGLAVQLAADLVGVDLQGQGVLRGTDFGAMVVRLDGAVADEAVLQRLLLHGCALLLLAQRPPGGLLDDDGWGFLAAGLGHWLEAEQGGGLCTGFAVGDRLLPPLRCFGGDFRAAARDLLAAGRLPAVADVVGAEVLQMTPEQHVLAFTLVELLLQPLPVTGGRQPELPMAKVLAAARAGSEPGRGLQNALNLDLGGLDQRLRAFVRARNGGR